MSEQPDLFTQPRYPQAPGFKRDGTSRAAAEAISPRVISLRERVLAALKSRGPMTPDECGVALGLEWWTVRPRFSELVRLGLIAPTGERRKNESGKDADVYGVLT